MTLPGVPPSRAGFLILAELQLLCSNLDSPERREGAVAVQALSTAFLSAWLLIVQTLTLGDASALLLSAHQIFSLGRI